MNEASDASQRKPGVAVDLDRLEAHASELYLHRFVEAVKEARGAHGRFLLLRSGDELAIRTAEDGSAELLEQIRTEPSQA
jgi:hypothetical protein